MPKPGIPMEKLCAWCGRPFTVVLKREKLNKGFCGTSCSAKWRNTQPWAKENSRKTIKLASAKWLGLTPEERSKVRVAHGTVGMRHSPETRQKLALARKGVPPTVRGGNGPGPTRAETKVIQDLEGKRLIGEHSWIVPIPKTVKLKFSTPNYYKIDVALPEMKIAIEADGNSHCTLKKREQDARKTEVLSCLGWRVWRFKNREILEDWEKYRGFIASL